MNTIKLAIAAIIASLLALGGYALYRAGSSGIRADAATAAVKQRDTAAGTTKTLQDKVNAANARLRAAERNRAAVRERLADAERRVLDDPNAGATADASREALREYAQEVDRDFAECRAELAALADEAAAASDAAHALSDAWPAVSEWNAATRAFSNAAQGMTK